MALFAGDKGHIETWFPDNDALRPRSAHGVHFKPGKTVAALFHARARRGNLGAVDDPYTFERQEAMWSDAAIDAVLNGNAAKGAGSKAKTPKDVQREAELKWCGRHGIRADAWAEVRTLYYDCRGGRLPPEKLAQLPEAFLVPPEQRTKGAMARAQRQPLLGGAGGGGSNGTGAASDAFGDGGGGGGSSGTNGTNEENLKATMRLKVVKSGRSGKKQKKATWRDQYYILDRRAGMLRAYDSNWPCDESALKHEIDLNGRLDGRTSPRWLDDECEIRFTVTPLAKAAKTGGEDREVVLKARTAETAALWAEVLREMLRQKGRDVKKAKQEKGKLADGGDGNVEGDATPAPYVPLHAAKAARTAWVPAEPMTVAEQQHARSKSAARMGGSHSKKFSTTMVFWLTVLPALSALVLLPTALLSAAWATLEVPEMSTSSPVTAVVGATRLEAGLWVLSCETVGVLPSCRRTLLLAPVLPVSAPPPLAPLLASQRHALLSECGALPVVANASASTVMAGAITSGGSAAAKLQDALVRGSCGGGWRAAQVMASLAVLPAGVAFLMALAHGRANEGIMLWLGLLLGVVALLGGAAVMTWSSAIQGRVTRAFVRDGAGGAAARLGAGFWCAATGSALGALGSGVCWWQIRDVTWRVTPGMHTADDVLSAMPQRAFHAGPTVWPMPKRRESDSDEETEVIRIN